MVWEVGPVVGVPRGTFWGVHCESARCVCMDVPCMVCVLGRACSQGGCSLSGCVCACRCVYVGVAEGEGSRAASLSSLDRAPEKI